MTSIDIGEIDTKQADIIKEKLEGEKTHMNFHVCCAPMPGGQHVSIETDYDASREVIIDFLMFAMASRM